MRILKTLLLTGCILAAFLLVGFAQQDGDKTPPKAKGPIIKIPVNKPVETNQNANANANKPNS